MLGWNENQFWDSDIRTLTAALEVCHALREDQAKLSWEQVRWQTSVLLAPHNKGKAVDPQKLVRFPWEKSEQVKPADFERVANKLGRKIK